MQLELEIPLVSENNAPKGYMYVFLKKKPDFLPRLGESILVLPDTYLKVMDIRYSGENLWLIRIILEPASYESRKYFEEFPISNKSKKWQYMDGKGYSHFLE